MKYIEKKSLKLPPYYPPPLKVTLGSSLKDLNNSSRALENSFIYEVMANTFLVNTSVYPVAIRTKHILGSNIILLDPSTHSAITTKQIRQQNYYFWHDAC